LAAVNNACSARQNIRPLAWVPSGCDNRANQKSDPRERAMPERATRFVGLTIVAAAIFLVASAADAQKKYDPGASDTEIRIGNIMP
jgi:hypothetical protein